MLKLQDTDRNTISEWDNIYEKDIGNHGWGGTWVELDYMINGYVDIFDYGCGMAHYLSHLKMLGKTVTGYERSTVAVANVKKRDPNLNISNLIPEKRFECVICMEVLEHLKDPKVLIDKLLDMAIYKLILTVPNTSGGKYHITLLEEKDFSRMFSQFSVNQKVIKPPWGSEKRIVEVIKCK